IFLIIIIFCIVQLSRGIYTDEYVNDIRDIELDSDVSDSNIKVYISGTSFKKELYNNASSLKQYGYNYKVLGIGEKFTGFRWKIEKYLAAAKEHRIKYGDDTIMIVMDGYDAFACLPPEGLYEKF